MCLSAPGPLTRSAFASHTIVVLKDKENKRWQSLSSKQGEAKGNLDYNFNYDDISIFSMRKYRML